MASKKCTVPPRQRPVVDLAVELEAYRAVTDSLMLSRIFSEYDKPSLSMDEMNSFLLRKSHTGEVTVRKLRKQAKSLRESAIRKAELADILESVATQITGGSLSK